MTLSRLVNNPKTVLVLFKSEWCHSCKKLEPIVKELVAGFPDKLDYEEVDVTSNADLAAEYEVFNLPTLLAFKEGKVLERFTGFTGKDKLMKKLNLTDK